AVVHPGVGLAQLRLSLTEGLDLGALQHDAGLEGLEEFVLAPGAPVGGDEATHLFVTANAAASAMVYEIDPTEMLRVDRAAQDLGADIMGVFHSHTHTDAYPSPTDVAQATDPGWHYVLVSLRDTHPVVRSYAIAEDRITEEPVDVPGLQVPGLDVRGLEQPG